MRSGRRAFVAFLVLAIGVIELVIYFRGKGNGDDQGLGWLLVAVGLILAWFAFDPDPLIPLRRLKGALLIVVLPGVVVGAIVGLVVSIFLRGTPASQPGAVRANVTGCVFRQRELAGSGEAVITVQVRVTKPMAEVAVEAGVGLEPTANSATGTARWNDLQPDQEYSQVVRVPSDVVAAFACFVHVTEART